MFSKKKKFIWMMVVTTLFLLFGTFCYSPSMVQAQEAMSPSMNQGRTTIQKDASTSAALAAQEAKDNNSPVVVIENVLGWLIYLLFAAISWIVTLLIWVMLNVMTYPININGTTAVVQGWQAVRDLCNNFFIVLLIIMSIATILRWQSYEYKSLLPKILLAAILVNFSRTLVGIGIDISQVIMLSFASAFATIQGGNIILAAIGLPDLANIASPKESLNAAGAGTYAADNGSATTFSFVNILAMLIYAIVVAIIVLIVVVVIIAILVMRIVALLFLAVLSPIYFFANAFSAGKKYSGQWMTEFVKYLTVGPVLLFFLWLSFMMMGYGGADKNIISGKGAAVVEGLSTSNLSGASGAAQLSTSEIATLSEAMSIPGIINVALVIGMLCASLVMAQRSGVAGAKFAGSAMGWIEKQGKKPMNWGKSLGKAAMTKVDRGTGFRAMRQGVGGYFAQRKKLGEETDKRRAQIVTGSLGYATGAVKGLPGAALKKWVKPYTTDQLWSVGTKQKEVNKASDQITRLKATDTIKTLDELKDTDGEKTINGLKVTRRADGNWDVKDSNDVAQNDVNRDDLIRIMSATVDVDNVGKIKDKKAFGDWSHDGNQWVKKDNTGKVIDAAGDDIDLRKKLDLEKSKKLDFNILSGLSGDALSKKINEWGGFNEVDLGNKEADLSKRRWKQAAVIGTGRAALAGVGAGLGMAGLPWMFGMPGLATIFSGGAGITAVGGAVIGAGAGAGVGLTTGKGLGNVTEWGEADKKLARSFKSSVVEDIRKDLKDLDNKELRATLDDKTLDRFTRIAAGMEAISRGMLSSQQAAYEKSEILRLSKTIPVLGGAIGKSDKKLEDSLDKDLTKNYVDLSKLVTDLGDITKRDKAMVKTNEQIAGGKLKLAELDAGSLNIIGKNFAEIMGGSNFSKQFDDLTKVQQEAVKDSIKKEIGSGSATYEQRSKLAKVTDMKVAFGDNDVMAAKFVKDLSVKDLANMVDDKESAKIEAIKKHIISMGVGDAAFDDTVRKAIARRKEQGQKIQGAFL